MRQSRRAARGGRPRTGDTGSRARKRSSPCSSRALGTLKGALSTFKTALESLKTGAAFSPQAATVSDDRCFTATADATRRRRAAMTSRSSLSRRHISSPPARSCGGNTAVVGTGTLTISHGTHAASTWPSTRRNNTLAGIRDAINKATGNTGVQATLIHETGGTRLVLTASKTGAANAIEVTQTGGDGGLNQLVYDPSRGTKNLDAVQPAQDAHITVAGFDHYSATNTISGAIDGVTLDSESDESTDGRDHARRSPVTTTTHRRQQTCRAFVDGFNALQKTVREPAQLQRGHEDHRRRCSATRCCAAVEDQVRSRPLQSGDRAHGQLQLARGIGITRQIDGTLALDADEARPPRSPTATARWRSVFGSTDGVAARLSTAHRGATRDRRDFDFRTSRCRRRSSSDRRTRRRSMCAWRRCRARYMKQFSALDAMLSQMQPTSS